MSLISESTYEVFKQDFEHELDPVRNIRYSLIMRYDAKPDDMPIGIIFAHYLWYYTGGDSNTGTKVKPHITEGGCPGYVCGSSVFWSAPEDRDTTRPLWALKEGPAPAEVLTIEPSVKCSCGLHGYITNGVWVPA